MRAVRLIGRFMQASFQEEAAHRANFFISIFHSVLNLGTTGQTLAESLLLYQELPASVRVVIQAVNPVDLLARPRIPAQKYNALFMYGYRPTAGTSACVHDILNDEPVTPIDRSELRGREPRRPSGWARAWVSPRRRSPRGRGFCPGSSATSTSGASSFTRIGSPRSASFADWRANLKLPP